MPENNQEIIVDKEALKRAAKQAAIPMEISVGALIRWVLPLPGFLAIAGVYPTWLVAGAGGIYALICAFVIVIGIMILNGLLIAKAARKGQPNASMTFIASSWLRIFACPLLGVLVWWIFRISPVSLGVWMTIFYLITLGLEIVWMIRAMRKHNKLHKISPAKNNPETEIG